MSNFSNHDRPGGTAEAPARNELRRRVRAPYMVNALLEVVGVTPRGEGCEVTTLDACEWGVRVRCASELQMGATARLQLALPHGEPRELAGWIVWSRQSQDGSWEAGVDFDVPEPLLSATRIDIAAFGR